MPVRCIVVRYSQLNKNSKVIRSLSNKERNTLPLPNSQVPTSYFLLFSTQEFLFSTLSIIIVLNSFRRGRNTLRSSICRVLVNFPLTPSYSLLSVGNSPKVTGASPRELYKFSRLVRWSHSEAEPRVVNISTHLLGVCSWRHPVVTSGCLLGLPGDATLSANANHVYSKHR